MITRTFREFIQENKNPGIQAGQVFKSKDKEGDLAGVLIFAKKVTVEGVQAIIGDKVSDFFTFAELNIDAKSIRDYNPEKDPKFKGAK